MMKFLATALGLACALLLAGCDEYFSVPPNAIGMVLAPTGYDGHVIAPGQVNLGDLDKSGQGNTLVLVERNGVAEKESFAGPAASDDHEDHRCLTADGAPVTVDVRMLLALPDTSTKQGEMDFQRLLLLGRPQADKNQKRTLWITASSVYHDQAQQQVRGKIRQVCASYANFNAINAAFAKDGGDGLTGKMQTAAGSSLVEAGVPLRIVNATVSNLKPDPTVIDAISRQQASEKQIAAIKTVTDFLDQDPSGGRREVYRLQVWQEIVAKGNANGHNTIFMTEAGSARNVVPMPVK